MQQVYPMFSISPVGISDPGRLSRKVRALRVLRGQPCYVGFVL